MECDARVVRWNPEVSAYLAPLSRYNHLTWVVTPLNGHGLPSVLWYHAFRCEDTD